MTEITEKTTKCGELVPLPDPYREVSVGLMANLPIHLRLTDKQLDAYQKLSKVYRDASEAFVAAITAHDIKKAQRLDRIITDVQRKLTAIDAVAWM